MAMQSLPPSYVSHSCDANLVVSYYMVRSKANAKAYVWKVQMSDGVRRTDVFREKRLKLISCVKT